MGLVPVAAWDTAYTASGMVGVPFVDESLSKNYNRIELESKLGYGGREPSEQGNIVCAGSINHELDYNNYTKLYDAITGTAASAHVLTDDDVPVHHWIALDKQVEEWRFGAAKMTKAIFSGEADSIVKLAGDWVCRDLARASVSMSPSVLTPTRVRFNDMTFRIGDQVNALTSGDDMEIASFEIEVDRLYKTDDYVNAQELVEPVPGDWRAVSLKIKFPRYAAATFQDWKDANTALQASLNFARGGESVLFELPELRLSEGFDAVTSGPEPYVQEGTLIAYRSSNSFMYVGNELRITTA
jgi:hypothetical protein